MNTSFVIHLVTIMITVLCFCCYRFATRLTDIKENSKFKVSESDGLKELIYDIKENYGLKYDS